MNDALNPAHRLHVLLTSALQGDPNERMLKVWARLFDIPEPTELKIVRCLLAMSDCIEEVKRLLGTRTGINLALYTSEFGSVEHAILPSTLRQTRAQVLTPHLQPTVLMKLEFCSEELRRFYVEDPISNDDLTSIRTAAEELFEQIYRSNLDPDLRLVLLEEIEKLKAAITLYRIRGAKGLMEAHRSLLGSIQTQSEAIAAASPEEKPVLARLGQLLKRVEELTSTATRIYKAVSGPVRLLLGLAGVDPSPPSYPPEVPFDGGSTKA